MAQQPSLLGLAAELRDNIYELALTSPAVINIVRSRRKNTRIHPLLSVCRQIRRETVKLYYAQNTFRLEVSDKEPLMPVEWLSSIQPDARKHIQKLTLNWAIRENPFSDSNNSLYNMIEERAVRRVTGLTVNAEEEQVEDRHYWAQWVEMLLRLHHQGFDLSRLAVDPQEPLGWQTGLVPCIKTCAENKWKREVMGFAGEIPVKCVDPRLLDKAIRRAEQMRRAYFEVDE